jgi:dihydroorotase-like cyclic amidohydrolase
MNTECDLLIKNGTLLDPSSGMNQKADIAAKGQEIAFIGKNSDDVRAKQILDKDVRDQDANLI